MAKANLSAETPEKKPTESTETSSKATSPRMKDITRESLGKSYQFLGMEMPQKK